MFDSISNAIYAIDDVIWGWWLIILLFGTHIFMTIRTGVIQRKTLSKGLKLSVTKDPDAEGEVSNFGALTTALAATIGTGKHRRCGNSDRPRRPGRCALVLALRRIRHRYQIFRVADRS